MIFLHVIGKNAPAFTVASLAITIASRPSTSAIVVTTPAAGAPPYSLYIRHALNSPHSIERVPLSANSAIRSRAVSRPFRCWRSTPDLPPPSSIRAASARYSAVAMSRADCGAMGATVIVGSEGRHCAKDGRRIDQTRLGTRGG